MGSELSVNDLQEVVHICSPLNLVGSRPPATGKNTASWTEGERLKARKAECVRSLDELENKVCQIIYLVDVTI